MVVVVEAILAVAQMHTQQMAIFQMDVEHSSVVLFWGFSVSVKMSMVT